MATLDTQDTGRRQTKQKTQYRKLTRLHQKPGMNPGAHNR